MHPCSPDISSAYTCLTFPLRNQLPSTLHNPECRTKSKAQHSSPAQHPVFPNIPPKPPPLTRAGIGASTAHTFASSGITNLALADINARGLSELASALKATHPGLRTLLLTVDTTSEESVAAAVRATVTEFGRVDIGVNSAGIAQAVQATHETPREVWERVVGVNQTGVWLVHRALVGVMVGQE